MASLKDKNAAHAYTPDSNKYMNTHRATGMEVGDDGRGLAVTSTNIYLFSNGQKVGFIQSASPSESRNIVKVQELGTEGVIQSVPSNTNGGQLSVSRLAVYNANLFSALGLTRTGQFVDRNGVEHANGDASVLSGNGNTFGNPFKTLKDQRVPLEIRIDTRMPGDKQSWYRETYIDCWLASYSKSVAANTITITEQATIQYSDVIVTHVSE